MRFVASLTCLALALLQTPLAVATHEGPEEIIVAIRPCISQDGLTIHIECTRTVIDLGACLVDSILLVDVTGYAPSPTIPPSTPSGWPPTFAGCPHPVPEIPCAYHMPRECPDRFAPWLAPALP